MALDDDFTTELVEGNETNDTATPVDEATIALIEDSEAGSPVIAVTDVSSLSPGMSVTLEDDMIFETRAIAAITVARRLSSEGQLLQSGYITLDRELQYAYAAGTKVVFYAAPTEAGGNQSGSATFATTFTPTTSTGWEARRLSQSIAQACPVCKTTDLCYFQNSSCAPSGAIQSSDFSMYGWYFTHSPDQCLSSSPDCFQCVDSLCKQARCSNPDTVHGGTDSRTRYAQSSVIAPATCQSQTQTRTCNAGSFGSWSGTYVHSACSVLAEADFIVGVPYSTVCPAWSVGIGSKSECKHAAQVLGKEWAITSSLPLMPKGCYQSLFSGKIYYYSSNNIGANNTRFAPVCKQIDVHCEPGGISIWYKDIYYVPVGQGVPHGWDASDPRYRFPHMNFVDGKHGGYATPIYNHSSGARLYLGSTYIAHYDALYLDCLDIGAFVDLTAPLRDGAGPDWARFPYYGYPEYGFTSERSMPKGTVKSYPYIYLPEDGWIEFWSQVLEYIDGHLENGTTVYIHDHTMGFCGPEEREDEVCEEGDTLACGPDCSGCGAGAVVSIAYRMVTENVSYSDAFDELLAERRCTNTWLVDGEGPPSRRERYSFPGMGRVYIQELLKLR